ncbi:cytochrome c maturation protein CcmE [Actinopolymorpha singaporensis]
MSRLGGWRRPGRGRLALLGLVLVVGVGVVAASGFEGTLTYYKTPTEVATQPALRDQHLRVGGLVVKGTLSGSGSAVRFELTDGAHDLDVVTDGTLPRTFRAGQGAVVEGRVDPHGRFRADRVLVRHSNQYRAPNPSRQAEDQ